MSQILASTFEVSDFCSTTTDMTTLVPPLCIESHFVPPGLISSRLRPTPTPIPTPTDSQASWQKSFASDASVLGESTASSIPTRSNTQDSVALPINPYSDGWSYMKLSMTDNDAWDWRVDQVRAAV